MGLWIGLRERRVGVIDCRSESEAVIKMAHLAFFVPIDDVVEPTPIFRFPCGVMGHEVRQADSTQKLACQKSDNTKR